MFTSLARWWRLFWSPEPEFKATGLAKIMSEPRTPEPSKPPAKKRKRPAKRTQKRHAPQPVLYKVRSPSKKG